MFGEVLIEKGFVWPFFARTKLIMLSKQTIIDIIEIIRDVLFTQFI